MAKILLVEDNPTNLALMSYLLGAFGHQTVSAANGEIGVALAEAERPELVLMDLQMPRMDGFAAARLIRLNPAMDQVRIIAVTASAMVGDRDKILAAGFDGYIAKPITPETFVTQVESFLGRPRKAPPA